jgi:hypothetical protein
VLAHPDWVGDVNMEHSSHSITPCFHSMSTAFSKRELHQSRDGVSDLLLFPSSMHLQNDHSPF